LTHDDDVVDDARSLLIQHLRLVVARHRADTPNDPCELAATDSLHAIMLQPPDENEKAATLRRQAVRRYGCDLGIDGLRKRENRLLDKVAARVFEVLTARANHLDLQTVSELLLRYREELDNVRGILFEGMPMLYPSVAAQDTELAREFVHASLFAV